MATHEEELKTKFIGKKILTTLTLTTDKGQTFNDILTAFKAKNVEIDDSVDRINSVSIILFEDKSALIFVDFYEDSYRSGAWNLLSVEKILMDENIEVKGIKHINSKITDIQKEENKYIITTKEYIISMGQYDTDSHYPSNFFTVEECKKYILDGVKKIR